MTVSPRVIFAAVASLFALGAVVAGVLIIGSPALERARKFDDQRINDLDQIVNSASFYVARHNQVPDSLELLATDAANGNAGNLGNIKDPVTQQPYSYTRTGALSYRLCATFQASPRPATDTTQYAPAHALDLPTHPSFDQHIVGQTCKDADFTANDIFCDASGVRCPTNQGCVVLPNRTRPICVATGQECAQAGCPTGCTIDKADPPHIACGTAAVSAEPVPAAPGTIAPAPVAQPPVAPTPATSDSCQLLTDPQTGKVDCFGCTNGTCNGAPASWQPYNNVGKMGIPYACFVGPNGCSLAQ